MDKLEKGETMKNPIEAYQTQYDKRLPQILRRTSCGIASMYSALNYLNQDLGSFPQFANDYVSLNSLNIPTYKAKMNMDGKDISIPLAYKTTENNVDDNYARNLVTSLSNGEPLYMEKEDNPNNEIIQTFSVDKGFDHRGIQPFLDKNNIPLKAELTMDSNIPSHLEKGSVILASVDMKDFGYPLSAQLPQEHISTHIVTIYQITKLGDTDVALLSDPAFVNPEEGIQVRSIESLRSCTNKFTTISPA